LEVIDFWIGHDICEKELVTGGFSFNINNGLCKERSPFSKDDAAKLIADRSALSDLRQFTA